MEIEWTRSDDAFPAAYWRLHFNALGSLLAPLNTELFAVRPPRELAPSDGLIISGKGPIWYYYGLLERFSATQWAAVYYPPLAASVVVRSKPDSPLQLGQQIPDADLHSSPFSGSTQGFDEGERPEFLVQRSDLSQLDGQDAVKLTYRGGRMQFPACLRMPARWLPVEDLSKRSARLLQLSGPMPIWMATAVAYQLIEALPACSLLLDDPKLSGAVALSCRPENSFLVGQVIPHQPRDKPAPSIAVVGDPQSGKSTLSWKLYHALLRRGVRCYRLDCDAQAPTAPWGMTEHGEAIRREYKRLRGGWTAEDVNRLVRQVQGLKRSDLDLVLLDMPGGDLMADPPQRIPADRVTLFREVDGYVRLDKNDVARDGWKSALAEIGAAQKVVARVEPCKDESAREFWPQKGVDTVPAHFCVNALERSHFSRSTEGVEHLASFLLSRVGIAAPSSFAGITRPV